MKNRVKGTRRARACLPILTLIGAAHAETLTYGVDAGVGETDNVALTHEDKTSQTLAVADFDADYKHKSQRLDVDAMGSFSYLDYLQHAYNRQLLGRFDGSADLALIPQRLTWVFKDDFGQAAINPFTPTTPTNIESINSVMTGPDLNLHLSGASFLNASARVGRTQYETSPYTNSRATGSLAWGLKLSPFSSASVNGDTERVLFENTVLNTDFERSNAFVRYELQGARTDLTTDLGATVIRLDDGSTTGGLARFKVARKISPSARLTLTLGHEITDGSTSFSGQKAGATGAVSTAPATNTPGNYTSDYASVGWAYERNRTTLGLSGRWERDDYPGLPTLDRTLTSGELLFERRLTRALTLRFTGRVYRTDYANATAIGPNGSPINTTSMILGALTWRHGRALEVKLTGEHTAYTTSPNDTGYKENRVLLTVGYRPFRAPTVDEELPDT